jgi:hypothetical protein
VVFVECYKKGGMHLRLLPLAIISFMLYSVGFPAILGYALFVNRHKITEDQVRQLAGCRICVANRCLLRHPAARPVATSFLPYLHRCHCVFPVQILRAYSLGDKKMENPNAWNVRRNLHKMYFHFQPQFWYWKLIIMIRKFLIVFAGACFAGDGLLFFWMRPNTVHTLSRGSLVPCASDGVCSRTATRVCCIIAVGLPVRWLSC